MTTLVTLTFSGYWISRPAAGFNNLVARRATGQKCLFPSLRPQAQIQCSQIIRNIVLFFYPQFFCIWRSINFTLAMQTESAQLYSVMRKASSNVTGTNVVRKVLAWLVSYFFVTMNLVLGVLVCFQSFLHCNTCIWTFPVFQMSNWNSGPSIISIRVLIQQRAKRKILLFSLLIMVAILCKVISKSSTDFFTI